MPTADGHLLGNFHAYYNFNPVQERLRFLRCPNGQALVKALRQDEQKEVDGPPEPVVIVDIGCNEGKLTMGFYNEVAGRKSEEAMSSTDVVHFDPEAIGKVNNLCQQTKTQVDYRIKEDKDTAHQHWYLCELFFDGEHVGSGSGVSKKVAKSKAASMALASNPTQSTANTDTDNTKELTDLSSCDGKRRSIFLLGVDIDNELIDKAKKEKKAVDEGDVIDFQCLDLSTVTAFDQELTSFAHAALGTKRERPYTLVTCFSVTMWVHLNHGDDGLWRFLDRISSITEHLVLEPQPWKCYRNAVNRLKRRKHPIPDSFTQLSVRQDVFERINAFLLESGRFRWKANFGTTNWSRPMWLYSRRKVPHVKYME